jgi:two-component SAPR family response regulator
MNKKNQRAYSKTNKLEKFILLFKRSLTFDEYPSHSNRKIIVKYKKLGSEKITYIRVTKLKRKYRKK